MEKLKCHSKTIRLPALGRHFTIGDIYDCRTDAAVNGKTLWSKELISNKLRTCENRSSSCKILKHDTFDSKLITLGINNDLKVSILGGLIPLRGSSRYLEDQTLHHHDQETVVLQYTCTTKCEEINIEELTNEKTLCPDIFVKGIGTHVVVGIAYGAQSFFTFNRRNSQASSSLFDTVKMLSEVELDSNGHVPITVEGETTGIQCRLYSDFETPYKPRNCKEVVTLLNSFPHYVESSGVKAMPFEICLYPLKDLDQLAAAVVQRVSEETISQLEMCFTHLDYSREMSSDMMNLPTVKAGKYSGVKADLQKFSRVMDLYKKHLQEQIGFVITRIRCGSTDESDLKTILREKESYVFARNQIDTWISQKCAQIELLSLGASLPNSDSQSIICLHKPTIQRTHSTIPNLPSSVASSSIMNSQSTSAHLEGLPFQHESFPSSSKSNRDITVRFHVSLGGTQFLTELMKSYLNNIKGGYLLKFVCIDKRVTKDGRQTNQVFEDMVKLSKQLKDFVQANKFNKLLKFEFVEDVEDNEKSEIYVTVLKNEETLYTDYRPPTAPGHAIVVKCSHDKVTIKWSEPEYGNENVLSYDVYYKHVNEDFSNTVKVDAVGQEGECILMNLELGSPYEVQVRAVCEIGLSQWSSKSSFHTLSAAAPGTPTAIHKVQRQISVQWSKPQEIAVNTVIEGYIVSVHDIVTEEVYDVQTDVHCKEEVTLSGIKLTSSYMFKVRALISGEETEQSATSDVLEPHPNAIMLEKFLSKSTIIAPENPAVCRLSLEEHIVDKSGKIRKCQLGEFNEGVTEKVIMVVGATGAGKTTFINGLINHILGVEWTDNFRFILKSDSDETQKVSQAESQTNWITSYTIHHQEGLKIPFTVTIIDTPGFGDTRGIERDLDITRQIGNFFKTAGEEGIDHIDAIGFVCQASSARLTPTQKFIFDQILALFGKDISENIFLLVTFADGQRPIVLDGVKAAGIPYADFFRFNNSALYADHGHINDAMNIVTANLEINRSSESVESLFWKMGETGYAKFFMNLSTTQPRSLTLTKDVLDERLSLEAHVVGIHQQIKIGLIKLEQLREEQEVLKTHDSDIQRNKDFTYTVTEHATKTEEIKSGTYITNCLQCNITCHYPCHIPDDDDKKRCAAMNKDGICTVCPSKTCEWNLHKNMTYRFVVKTFTKIKTSDDLKARYATATQHKVTAEGMVQQVLAEFEKVQSDVLIRADEVRKSLDRLKEIALKPNPLSTAEYVDKLIASEEAQKAPGWKNCIRHLVELRSQAETLQRLAKPGFDPFKEYTKCLDLKKKGGKAKSFIQWTKDCLNNFIQ